MGGIWGLHGKNIRVNQKLFYRVLKNFRNMRECPLKYIKGKDWKLLTNNIEIMNRWREYFLELLDGTEEGMDLIA
jgi:hypothetical protein